MAAVAKAEILDAISGMTVLELSNLIKDLEEKFGGADRVHGQPSGGRRQQGQCHQGGPRSHQPGS